MSFLYLYSLDQAHREDEVMLWRDSLRENIRCKEAIEKALSENFDGMHLKDGIIPPLAEEYGIDRLTWVLANTVKEHPGDGRFRPENKEWAGTIPIPKDSRNYEFSVGSHPEIVNGLISDYRKYLAEVVRQFGAKDCIPGSTHTRYENQLLILDPFLLNEDYKHGDYQLFYARSGNGCDESKIGRKVFGEFLKDGEKTSFYRNDFLGIADERKLPEWARDRLFELRNTEKKETNPEHSPRTLTITDPLGNELKLRPRLELYSVNDFMGQEKYGLAIVLDTVSEEPEQYAVLTKSFGEFIGMKDCAYICIPSVRSRTKRRATDSTERQDGRQVGRSTRPTRWYRLSRRPGAGTKKAARPSKESSSVAKAEATRRLPLWTAEMFTV